MLSSILKKLFLNFIILLLLLGGALWGDLALAYNCQSNVANGNWSVSGSWTSCNGVAPGVADTVTIRNGHTITLNTSPSITTLAINNGGTLTADASSRTLTLTGTSGTVFTQGTTGTFTPNNSRVLITSAGNVTLTSGNITFYDLQLAPTSTRTYTFGSGTLIVNNNLTVGDGENNLTVNLDSNDPDLTVTGNVTLNNPSTWTASASAALTLSPSGTKTFTDSNGTKQNMGLVSLTGGSSTPVIGLGSAMTVTNLTVASGHTLDTAASNYTLTVTGDLTNSGTIAVNNSTVTVNGNMTLNNPSIWSKSSSATLILSPNGTKTFTDANGTKQDLGLVSITGGNATPVILLGSDVHVTDLTIADWHLLDTSANSYNLTVSGSWTDNGTFTYHNSTVTFDSSGTSYVNGNPRFYNLRFMPTVGSSATYIFGANGVVVSNDLTVGNGTNNLTVDLDTNDPYFYVYGNMTLNSPSTWVASSGSWLILSANGTKTLTDLNDTKQDLGLVYIGDGTGTPVVELGSDIHVNEFYIDDAVDTTQNNYNMRVSGNWTNYGTFTANNSTVTFDSPGDAALRGEKEFYNLQFVPTAGNDAHYFIDSNRPLTVDNDLTIGNGVNALIMDFDWNDPDVTLKGNVTLNNFSTWYSSWNDLVFSPTGTKTYTDLNVTKQNLGPVVITGGSSSPQLNLASGMSVTDLTIDTGHVLEDVTAGTHNLTVSENWTNSGTFIPNNNTVTFNSGDDSYLTGENTFYNLTISNTGGKRVYFPTAGTDIIHVTNDFTVSGALCNMIRLYSASNGNLWHFHPTGSASITYADVRDGGCEPGAINMTPSNTVSSGNNGSCWVLPASIHGTVYDNTSDNRDWWWWHTPIGASVCDGSTNVVRIRDNGTAQNTAVPCCSSDSSYIVPVAVPAGHTMTVYLDNTTAKATTVSRSSGAYVGDLDLYQDRVIVRHDDAGPITNADLAHWDGSNEGDGLDGDIGFTVSGGNLTTSSTRELHVWDGSTFAPGGNVTTQPSSTPADVSGDLHVGNQSTLSMENHALSIGGDFDNDWGTFSKSSGQTTTFTGTASAFNIWPGTGNYENIVFNGVGGEWNFQDDMMAEGNFTITNGQVNAPWNLGIGGNYSNAGTFSNRGGWVEMDSDTPGHTLSGNMTGASAFQNLYFGSQNGMPRGGGWIFNNNAVINDQFYIDWDSTVDAPPTLNVGHYINNWGKFRNNSGTVTIYNHAQGSMTETNQFYYLNLGGYVQDNIQVNKDLQLINNVTGWGGIEVDGGNMTGDYSMNMTWGLVSMHGTGNFGGNADWSLYNLQFGDGSTPATTTAIGTGVATTKADFYVNDNHVLTGAKSFTLQQNAGGGGTVALTGGTVTAKALGNSTLGSTANNHDWTFNHLIFKGSSQQQTVYICSNGFVSFTGDSDSWDAYSIPDANLPNGYIAGWQEDLWPEAGGTIKYAVFGTAPYRVFVTEFNQIHDFSTALVTFQIDLYETSNLIEVHYNGTSTGSNDWATAGVESLDGTAGVGDFVQQSNVVKTNTATRYTPSGGTYTMSTIPLKWYDLSAGATQLNLSDDEVSAPISLPFVFDFFPVDGIVTLANGGTGKFIINGDLSIGESDGLSTVTLDNEINDRTIDVNGNVIIEFTGTLEASSSSPFTVSGDWSAYGIFTSGTGTVTFDRTGGTQNLNGGGAGPSQSFYNLDKVNGGTLKLVTDSADVRAALTMTSGTLDGGSRNLYLGGDWTISTHFLPQTGGVIFNGNSSQMISGDNTWYALAITGTTERTVTLPSAKTQTILPYGSLTFEGGADDTLTLAPSVPASSWNLRVSTSGVLQVVDHVNASYSNAGTLVSGDATINASDVTNIDGGHNVNWCFSNCGAVDRYRRRGAFNSFFE